MLRSKLLAMAVCATAAAVAPGANVLVSSRFTNNVLMYDDQGQFIRVFASGNGLANPNGIAYGPDGNLYVGLGDTGKVLRFEGQAGAFIDEFVKTTDNGGLAGCRAIAFGPDGNLYVNSGPNNQVLKYDGLTGHFLGVLAQGQSMNGPVGLTFGPDGNWYIGCALSNAVYVFDQAGAYQRTISCGSANRNATGVRFDGAGRLLVAESVTNNILQLDAQTGGCVGVYASSPLLSIPIYTALTPSGDLLVGSFGNDSVVRIDRLTQAASVFIASGSGGLDGTHAIARIPCAADFNHNGQITVQDVFDFLAAWFAGLPSADFDRSGLVSIQDLFGFLAAWFSLCM